jgi:hypothetical protein
VARAGFEKGVALRAATSKERRASLRDKYENGGFGLWVGLWQAREGCSRRRRCAAVRFDAANQPRATQGEVICRAPPATAVVVPGTLVQSTQSELKAAC